MSFYVKLGNEGCWRTETVTVDRSTTEAYSAGGLRCEAIFVMRTWRISFNGLVEDAKGHSKHLRAVFV